MQVTIQKNHQRHVRVQQGGAAPLCELFEFAVQLMSREPAKTRFNILL